MSECRSGEAFHLWTSVIPGIRKTRMVPSGAPTARHPASTNTTDTTSVCDMVCAFAAPSTTDLTVTVLFVADATASPCGVNARLRITPSSRNSRHGAPGLPAWTNTIAPDTVRTEFVSAVGLSLSGRKRIRAIGMPSVATPARNVSVFTIAIAKPASLDE